MAIGADYSAGRPSGKALHDAGFTFVIRYVGLGAAGKQLTAAEYADLTAHGITVYLVVELGTDDSWGTASDDDRARGKANAQAGWNHAKACGVPENEIFLFLASDKHAANQWQITDTVEYLQGGCDAVGVARVGHYGFVETQRAVRAAGVARGFWRAGSKPSGGDERWVHFWQRNAGQTQTHVDGVLVDINDELNELTISTEDDMPSLDEIYTKIWYNALWTQKDASGKVIGTPNPSQVLAMLNDKLDGISRTETTQSAQIAGLVTTVTQLAQNQGATNLTEDKLRAMLNDAVAQNVKITGTVEITGAEQPAAAAQ